MFKKLGVVVAVSLLSTCAFMSSSVAAKEKPVLRYLAAEDVNPVQLLTPPPADGTEAQKAGVAEVLAIARGATAARMEKAIWDDRNESAVIWERIIGPSFSLKDLPATKAALDEMQNESDAAADFAKVYFNRLRPWNFDKDIPLCSEKGRTATPRRSIPTGHATMAYTQAMLLTKLMPSKADAIMLGAQDYSFSRVVCGTHYTDDLPVSQTLGTVVGTLMIRNDAFRPKVEAARAELIAAGLAAK